MQPHHGASELVQSAAGEYGISGWIEIYSTIGLRELSPALLRFYLFLAFSIRILPPDRWVRHWWPAGAGVLGSLAESVRSCAENRGADRPGERLEHYSLECLGRVFFV